MGLYRNPRALLSRVPCALIRSHGRIRQGAMEILSKFLFNSLSTIFCRCGIICAEQTAEPFAAAIQRQPLQSSGLRMLHHSPNRLCRFFCRFAAGKPFRACRCGIITAGRLLYWVMPNGSPLTRQPPCDGRLYHPFHGQGDARTRPAPAPMANDTMTLRRRGIIFHIIVWRQYSHVKKR